MKPTIPEVKALKFLHFINSQVQKYLLHAGNIIIILFREAQSSKYARPLSIDP